MLRLDLDREPKWLDLAHGVRVKVAPLSSSVMLAAQSDAAVLAVGADEDANAGRAAEVVAKAIARAVIDDWEGVGDANGDPVAITPERIDALLDLWPIFEAFQAKYVATGFLLDAEKNVSPPLPNGSSAGAGNTARPALKSARNARPAKTDR